MRARNYLCQIVNFQWKKKIYIYIYIHIYIYTYIYIYKVKCTRENLNTVYICNLQNLYDAWCIDTSDAWTNAITSSIFSQFWKIDLENQVLWKIPKFLKNMNPNFLKTHKLSNWTSQQV